MVKETKSWLQIFSWGLYDLANQFFAVNVVSLYFVRWITLELRYPELFYSIAFSISTLFIAFTAPVLGRISDLNNRYKLYLTFFTLFSVIFTILLGVIENVYLALIFFGLANFGCQIAVVFYNALLPHIAPQEKLGLVSGIGRMLGYMGAIVSLYLIKPFVIKEGYQSAFLPTGILFLIFSLPCMIFVKEKRKIFPSVNFVKILNRKFLADTIQEFKIVFLPSQNRNLKLFLKSAFLVLCVVNIVILFMSVYATVVFKFTELEIINLMVFSTFFAIATSFFFGYTNDYIGSKNSLKAIFILWISGFVLAALASVSWMYWLVGAVVGSALGATWTILRVLTVRIVKKEMIGEVFGLFNLVGYLSAIVGSIFWGMLIFLLTPLGTVRYRIALLSLNIFLILAWAYLEKIQTNV